MRKSLWTVRRLWNRRVKKWHTCACCKNDPNIVVPFLDGHDMTGWINQHKDFPTVKSTGYGYCLRKDYLVRKPQHDKKP